VTDGEILTMEEIKARYDGEWVVLIDVESDPGPVLRRAHVYWHGADGDQAWSKVDELPAPLNAAVLYIGAIYADEEPVPIL
jgi:hypothetical protein